MTNIILCGCNGKMGQVIARMAEEKEDVAIVCGIDINTASKNGFPVFSSIDEFTGKADAIIDFSHPSSLEGNLKYAAEHNVPAVIATTGLSKEQKESILHASEKSAIFFSANMSLGVNLIIELVSKAAEVLGPDFDIEIIEKHHNQKIDAPSGTALAIADAITEVRDAMEYTYDRHSVRKKRGQNEIGIHAVRGGTIVGEHSVLFAGQDEIVEIKHTAMSKEIFAAGAIAAAKFMKGKNAGFYSMKNLVSEITK